MLKACLIGSRSIIITLFLLHKRPNIFNVLAITRLRVKIVRNPKLHRLITSLHVSKENQLNEK